MICRIYPLLFLISIFARLFCFGQSDPLPSWNKGQAKEAILEFVKVTTQYGNETYIPPAERIATFDQDGTLWVEQPLYTQFIFAREMLQSRAASHLEWRDQEPYRTVLEGNLEKMQSFTIQDIEKIIAAAHSGLTVEEFEQLVVDWLQKAKDQRFQRLYTELVYQPMLELIRYLKEHEFKVYIVSGGGQEFIRTYTEKVYGIPPERIIGSATKVRYEYRNGSPVLVRLPEVLFIDNKQGKVEGINLIIGRHPIAAFGNSDGDQQMLEWTQSGKRKTLQLLIHHDDAEREYAYDFKSGVGTFSPFLMTEAKKRNWIIVSMKNDWKNIFTWEKRCIINSKQL